MIAAAARAPAPSLDVPAFEVEGLRVMLDNAPLISDATLSVARGECLGVVGESGCGKTVTFLGAMGLLPRRMRVTGRVRLAGEDLLGRTEAQMERIRGRRVGMIFQDPQSGLNPVRTIGRQLIEPLRLHLGLSPRAARDRAVELLSMVGIPTPASRLSAYPHEISGGMAQRVMIAIALASEPEVLIADEPTTALDVTVQLQVLDLIRKIQQDSGLAVIFITHDLGVVAEICQRVTVMYAGHTVETQAVPRAFATPLHPYTDALLRCLPGLDGTLPAFLPGEVPVAGHAPPGCPFHPRCARAGDPCREAMPAGQDRARGRVACHFPLEAAP
ncbi:MAG: ABC transporter ATP-binding protein [Pseudooceanicola sp.]|nr:ABC transporter ATP-binding protein [Pseudooceanicola sp.]